MNEEKKQRGYNFINILKEIYQETEEGAFGVKYNIRYLEENVGNNYISLFTQCGFNILIKRNEVILFRDRR